MGPDKWYPEIGWDPFIGCKPRSAGCRLCYGARRIGEDFPNDPSIRWVRMGNERVAQFTGVTRFAPSLVNRPLLLARPSLIFFGEHFDPFQPAIEFRQLRACFDVMYEASQHKFNVLTRYPENAARFAAEYGELPPNVRLGISAETQADLDARWPALREIHAEYHIISLEPLLGPVTVPADFGRFVDGWVVAMCEVGPLGLVRRSRPEWFRSLRDQCAAIGVAFYWETTSQDDQALVNERLAQRRAGTPYTTQHQMIGLPVTQ